MTYSKAVHLIPVVGTGLLAIVAFALGNDLARGSGTTSLASGPTSGWLIALGLVGAGYLAALLLLAVYGVAGARHRRRLLQARLNRLEFPALISGMNGKVQWTNRAFRAAGWGSSGDGQDEVTACLAGAVAIDAALIYRLARRAREIGFALEPVPDTPGEGTVVVTVQLDLPEHLVWTLCPPDRLPEMSGADDAGRFDPAPLAHLQIDATGHRTANQKFRNMFGDPAVLPDGLPQTQDEGTCGRFLLRRKDGVEQLCQVSVFATGGDGNPARDMFISPASEGTPESNATAVLKVVPVALAQFDLDGRMLWCNSLAQDILGPDVVSGASLTDMVEPLGRPIDSLAVAAAADPDGRREMVRLRRDGHETFLQITLTPVALDGHRILLAVLSDASELRLLEDKFAQSQKMEAVGKLAGGVAHDFNNVLTAISGHSDLLLLGKDALHPDYSDLMQIRQNTHRASALVRQLLAFSRKQTLNPALLSVQDVVSDTQYLLNRLVGETVTLTLEHGRGLGSVRADYQQLEQALMNLVVNARDAMPGGGTIAIATRNLLLAERMVTQGVDIPAGAYVEISVSDEGSGIEPALLAQVFEPFFTTKALGEGTGLGLSTVYGIVKQSGGYVFAENRCEGGARFRILLPRVEPGAEGPPPPPAIADGDRRDHTGTGRILLVEDEGPVRSFASRALTLRGYEVFAAASAEEATTFLAQSADQVDLLISDVVMPGMDGPTFAATARKMRPGLRVIFISGYAEGSFRRNLVDHDFLFLPKPFSLTDLTAKVKEALAEDA